jgi:hypothetical protein
MATPALEARIGTTDRRTRREALARWAPWGPTARRAIVERQAGPRLELGYLLRHARGVDVTTPDGTRIGTVERLEDETFDFWPSVLVVRTESGERLRIRSDRVLAAHPREGRLVVGPEPEPRVEPWTSGSRRAPKRAAGE